nr:mechanosensitive ion channel family protein [Methanolobus chelungpuianus]
MRCVGSSIQAVNYFFLLCWTIDVYFCCHYTSRLLRYHRGHIEHYACCTGVGNIIVGLAAQTTLINIILGGALLIDRRFCIGGRIRAEQLDMWGGAIEIGWRSTRILIVDNHLVAIPNSISGTGPVINYSIPEKIFRIGTDMVVSYGPDIDYIKGLIKDALGSETWVMHERPVQVLLLQFTDHGVKLNVR